MLPSMKYFQIWVYLQQIFLLKTNYLVKMFLIDEVGWTNIFSLLFFEKKILFFDGHQYSQLTK